jgi:hypothetical protein
MAADAAHQHHFGANLQQLGRRCGGVLRERDQDLVEAGGRAPDQVIHADRGSVR